MPVGDKQTSRFLTADLSVQFPKYHTFSKN
uniref:Uncharacterized protein n=1 Tax=Arundo donax TaxID=35708 RepID=A0A0A9A2F0_ARUDO